MLKFHLQGVDEDVFTAVMSFLNTLHNPTINDLGVELASPLSCKVAPIQLSTLNDLTIQEV